MTIIRSGASQKYADSWDQAFGKSDKKMQGASSAKKSGVKSAVKQSTAIKKKKKPNRRVNKVARKK